MKALLLSLLLVADPTPPRFGSTYTKGATTRMASSCRRAVREALGPKTRPFCACYVRRIQDLVSSDELPNLEPSIVAEVRRIAANQCLEEVGAP